ncbi:MAG: ArnT family glycosyltransferase [Leptolyngbyaceae cyanobacterium]
MSRTQKRILLVVMLLCIAFISLFSFNRSYIGFGTETDYLGGFVPEARRFLRGDSLLLEFHPPLYSMVVALVQTIVQEWFRAGLLVSLISSAIVLIANFFFFYNLLGIYAAWGTIAGLITSTQFIEYSAYATSDIFFFALYSIALLISLLAIKRYKRYLWILCGLAVGCLILTRTNGITCLAIVLLPWCSRESFRQKLNGSIYFVSGLLIPLGSWSIFAWLSGSPLKPSSTYANLALTYFSSPSSNRISGDERIQLEAQFNSLIDVIRHDPVHIIKIYYQDIMTLIGRIPRMLQDPLNIFVPIGVLALFYTEIKNRKVFIFYIFLTLIQALLLNFKAYEARYFLFLIAILGAILGEAFRYLINLVQSRKSRRRLIGFCGLCGCLALILSSSSAWRAVDSSVGELKDVIPKVQPLPLGQSGMIARKPHLPFYTDTQRLSFPNVETLEELGQAVGCSMKNQSELESIFLYFGTKERLRRPQFSALSNPETSPDWLMPIQQSSRPDLWVLYEYLPDRLSGEIACPM